MVDRQVNWEYVAIGVLGTVIIMSGIFAAGYKLSDYKVDSLRSDIRNLEVSQQSQLLTFELSESVEGKQCQAMKRWVEQTVQDTRDLRREVARYENSRKIRNPRYKSLKKRYMNLLVQNLLEVRKVEEECNQTTTEIIYFYSNDNCDNCENQGKILTFFRRKYGESLVVYPLDTDLELQSVEFLENSYQVENYPTIVVEGEVHRGFQSKRDLQNILQNTTVADR